MSESLFRKYPSIENHYLKKHIGKFISRYDKKLLDEHFLLQEKIHGANFQLILTPENIDNPIACSRNRVLAKDENFYGVDEILSDMDFSWMHQLFDSIEKASYINLYGELFGGGIQKGVDYGDKKRILWFDMKVNDTLLTQAHLIELFRSFGYEHLLVPSYGIVKGLETALAFDTKKNTLVGPTLDDNITEGIVIKPYYNVFYEQRDLFYIKKKNDEFKDKQRSSKKKIDYSAQFSEEVNRLRKEFVSYANENAVQSVFSKKGIIQDTKEIGKYIGFVMNDVYETFCRENPEFDPDNFERRELKFIRGNVKEISKILIKEL